ncbi:MAG: AtpZ/AtpI family protein [Phototrophicaceae bacterium]
MTDDRQDVQQHDEEREFAETIDRKAQRKQRARSARESVWFGLGTFGMVGWSIAIPTVLGALLGTWLDENIPADFSWRLTLIVLGVVMGCLNAWYWISKEQRRAEKPELKNPEERRHHD